MSKQILFKSLFILPQSPNDDYGTLSASWGTVALLPNPMKEKNQIILELWKKQLRKDNKENDTDIKRLDDEASVINKSGILKIKWPIPVKDGSIDDYDLLLATVTSPEVDNDSYPEPIDIASKMIKKNYWEYFFKNIEENIMTYQDTEILKILFNRDLNQYLIDIPDQKCSVDIKKIKNYDSEDKYTELSVELFKEISEIQVNISKMHFKENDKIYDYKDVG